MDKISKVVMEGCLGTVLVTVATLYIIKWVLVAALTLATVLVSAAPPVESSYDYDAGMCTEEYVGELICE